MKKRVCSNKKSKTISGYCRKTICLPFDETGYEQLLKEDAHFRAELDKQIQRHPELFPDEIKTGYWLNGFSRPSRKMDGFRMRIIKLKATGEVYLIRPSFVMPYLTGATDTVEKGLFLLQFGVPYWALSYVFGQNDMYWYRQAESIGRHSIVGTTVKDSDHLPTDLLADEKHTAIKGQKAYVATTVGDDCVLGASISLTADEAGLAEAYSHFKTEALTCDPDYQPKTVNTDGWTATINSWRRLFPSIVAILCFLHGFIKIRSCAKNDKELFETIRQKVWDVYHQPAKVEFLAKATELKDWTMKNIRAITIRTAIVKLCNNAPAYALAYEHPSAYRTSNMIDRALNRFDRYLYCTQYFHGHIDSAERRVRAWAIMHNFRPYHPKIKKVGLYHSPFHKLNGFVYHPNWLHNLLIATSMAGCPG